MSQELVGIEYLHKNVIQGMKCDMTRPFAFISYSHDDYDTKIVNNVFKELYTKGINVWIDTANMPVDENNWKKSAIEALRNHNCKFAFFFRSESSLTKRTIADEIKTIKRLKHIGPIVTIDIWHEQGNNAENFHDELLNTENDSRYDICEEICGYVNTECKALRLAEDMGNNIHKLVDEILELDALKLLGTDASQEEKTIEKSDDSRNTVEVKTTETVEITETTENAKPVLPENGYISLGDFLKKYNNSNFKKKTFGMLRLVGQDEFAKYSTDYHDSAFSLVWNFIMKLLAERGIEFIQTVNNCHPNMKNPVFIDQAAYNVRDDQNKYRKIEVSGLENYYMYRHFGQYDWIYAVLRPRMAEFGLPMDKFGFEYKGSSTASNAEIKPMSVDKPVSMQAEKPRGGITGPVALDGGEGVKRLDGRFSLREFLTEHNNKTFQSKSCNWLKLIGKNGYEKFSMEQDENGKVFETARQLVFGFAMKRIDEMGMEYINTVNEGSTSKNPIFITEEEHAARKARKESVSYTKISSGAVSGYSMCTHYSEYDWLKNSLVKQITALGCTVDDFDVVLG